MRLERNDVLNAIVESTKTSNISEETKIELICPDNNDFHELLADMDFYFKTKLLSDEKANFNEIKTVKDLIDLIVE